MALAQRLDRKIEYFMSQDVVEGIDSCGSEFGFSGRSEEMRQSAVPPGSMLGPHHLAAIATRLVGDAVRDVLKVEEVHVEVLDAMPFFRLANVESTIVFDLCFKDAYISPNAELAVVIAICQAKALDGAVICERGFVVKARRRVS